MTSASSPAADAARAGLEPEVDTAGSSAAEPAPVPAELFAPPRLLGGAGSEFERQLLGASGLAMPAASHERLARALQLPAAAGVSAPAQQALLLQSAARWSKLGMVAVLGGMALVLPLASRQQPGPAEPAASSVAPALLADVPAALPELSPLPSVVVAPAVTPAEQAIAARPSAERAPRPRRTPRAPSASAPAEQGGLRAELLALEAAQSALHVGRSAEAARLLDRYAARFPRGELALEAELLRIDVSLAKGAAEQAHARARQLLARSGAERYRERLEALIGERGAQHTGVRVPGIDGAGRSHEAAEVNHQ